MKQSKEMIPKKSKRKSARQLKKKLWIIFSKYIRQRDKYRCISCGKQLDKYTSEAGHFVHNQMDFSELNINCQCTRCNKWLHGNLGNYAINLQWKIGGKKVKWLLGQKGKVEKYTVGELELLIKDYTNKLNE